jgi:signal transduction histidine kinase
MEESGQILIQSTIQKVVLEFHRIEWDVENINYHTRIFKDFAEQVFQDKGNGKGRVARGKNRAYSRTKLKKAQTANAKSCVFLPDATKLSPEDIRFLRLTESMDSIFMAVVSRNPHILFAYTINPTGITRGYPFKDFSILPQGFSPIHESFYYLADQQHNPERKEQWTEPYLCLLTRTWMATCTAPIYENEVFMGIIGIDIELALIIEPLDKTLKLIPGGYAFLVSSKGNMAIFSSEGMNGLREDHMLINKELIEARLEDRCSIDEVEVREVRLSAGKAHLLHAYFECNGWSIVSVLPRNRRASRNVASYIDGHILLSSNQPKADRAYLPMMSFISSFTESLKRMEKLIEGTKIIGKGILDHRIAIESKDEIGLLAISINKMAAELEKRKEEIESAYKKISQMNRLSAIGRLTAGIAHEINNPLSIISNYIQLFSRNLNVHPDIQADFLIVEEEIYRMSEITKRLLSFSGESAKVKSIIQVNGVLQAVLGLLKYHLKSQGITLTEAYAHDLPLVVGSSTELQQTFLNILLNAVQAMTEGGTLKVSTKCIGKRGKTKTRKINVSISDTGSGIEEKFLDKIFDPFFTLRGRGEGTGLGLSISYGVIKEHEGTLDVVSKQGKGTMVKITLPGLD